MEKKRTPTYSLIVVYISQNIAETVETISPLQTQIDKFGKILSLSILIVVILIFVTGFLRGNDWVTMFMTSIALAVSAIPEGLPISVISRLKVDIQVIIDAIVQNRYQAFRYSGRPIIRAWLGLRQRLWLVWVLRKFGRFANGRHSQTGSING